MSNQTANRLIDFIDSSTSEDREIHLTASDSFLQNLIASTDESKFDLQMKRLLKKYSERKFEEAERKKMVINASNILKVFHKFYIRISVGIHQFNDTRSKCLGSKRHRSIENG